MLKVLDRSLIYLDFYTIIVSNCFIFYSKPLII